MNDDDKKKQVILWVVVGAIILAAIIFLLVFIFKKSDSEPYRPGPGDRGGQNRRPTGPLIPGTPTPTGSDRDGDGSGGTPTPDGGDGRDRNTTPTGRGGRGGNTTPTGGGNGGNTTPTGGGNGGNTTPTGGGNGGNTTPTGGGNGGNTTPTGGGNGGNATPTPRIGGPTPTPRGGGGGTTPTPRGRGDDGGTAFPDYNWDASGMNGARIAEQDDSYNRNGLNFGDERWQLYLSDLFTRVSPDYSVDALNVLDKQGQELFMQMAELYGTGKVTRESRNDAQKEEWDQIAEEIHETTTRSGLEELIIKYSVTRSKYQQYRQSWEEFDDGLYEDDDERRTALLKSDCYMIIVGLQQRMPEKGLGYSWNEALTTVLRDSGKPMAEAVDAQDDIELFMELGGFFNGSGFDTLTYAQKKLWWEIEAEVNKAEDTDRLEELIVLYRAETEAERTSFQQLLDSYPDPSQKRERRSKVIASELYQKIIPARKGMFSIMGTDYETWNDALGAVLKGRVTVSGDVNAGGQETETTDIKVE